MRLLVLITVILFLAEFGTLAVLLTRERRCDRLEAQNKKYRDDLREANNRITEYEETILSLERSEAAEDILKEIRTSRSQGKVFGTRQ